jgi:peptidoglycan/xylan/chitin deacetylase (PgdA/CDA1 family)
MTYFAKTPWWLKKLYSECIWELASTGKNIYLTFDDGPHPIATPFVLAELKKYNAKATFFCIGKNVAEHAGLYRKILDEGHSVGNHTNTHLNGWRTKNDLYLQNIMEAKKNIRSVLFRPPYGRIKKSQIKLVKQNDPQLKIIMWSVLSGDFDTTILPDDCFKNVVNNTRQNSIVVFHDSEKAFKNLEYTLPKVLQYFSEKGFHFEKIP